MPVSIAATDSLLYVVNQGGTPNINGFTIDRRKNRLTPLAGSLQPLAGGTAASPGDINFNADASVLLVTEKGTQLIDTFLVNPDGIPSPAASHPSSGKVPFGFSVTRQEFVIVSEAGSGAASSYALHNDGNLDLISGSVPSGQILPCWLKVNLDGTLAYTASPGSGSISLWGIASDGALKLTNPTAAMPGPPIDLNFSNNDEFLYARVATGSVSGFRVASDGTLTSITTVTGLPNTAAGLAAH
jgi:6-phosphogluconolactonase (cycloisomerase 2 family)